MIRRKWFYILSSLIFFVFVALNIPVIFSKTNNYVEVDNIQEMNMKAKIITPGQLNLNRYQKIDLNESNSIKEIYVDVGENVQKNSPLFQYDNASLEKERKNQKLSLEAIQTQINHLAWLRINLEEKKKSLIKEIGEKGAEKQVSSELKQNQYESKLLEIERSKVQLELNSTETEIEELTVFSNIDGTVFSINHDNKIDGTPFIEIASQKDIILTGEITEFDVLNVNKGQTVSVTTDVIEGESWSGKVIDVSYLPSRAENSDISKYEIKVELAKYDPRLKPGFQVVMEIITDERKVNALHYGGVNSVGQESYIFVLQKDNTVKKVPIETGLVSGDYIEIIGDINPNDSIIIKSDLELEEGSEVEVK